MIFETERLVIRKLSMNDLHAFHELESSEKVLRYATGNVKTLKENNRELVNLIEKYNNTEEHFFIYAVILKENSEFIGTVALIKEDADFEIGYRFIECFWNKGYATELCRGLLEYCKQIGIKKIIAYVVDVNTASAKILHKHNFKVVERFVNDENRNETKYAYYLC